MAGRQNTLIYIEKENITEAEFMSRSFVNKEIKNRAYINALGAELAMKYLASEGIQVENVHNIHSISKILETIDIADILLPNIHIDVRVVFDDNQIFIPKSHFKFEITPDIYLVLKLDKKFEHVEFLGYFRTKQINKKNENDEYYFFEKNKLSSPDTLKKFIKDFTGSTSRDISEEDMLRGRELSISLADHNITNDETKELLELLLLNDSLRESVLEFDNFETLAYNVASELGKNIEFQTPLTLDETNQNDEPDEVNQEININTDNNEELVFDESFFDNNDENKTEDETDAKENIDIDEKETTEITEEIESEEPDTITEQTEEEQEEQNSEDNIVESETEISEDEEIKEETTTELDITPEETEQEELLNNSIIESDEHLPDLDEKSIDLGDDMLDEDLNLPEENLIQEPEMIIEDNIQEESLEENNDDTTSELEPLPLLNEESIDLGDDLLDEDTNLSEPEDLDITNSEDNIESVEELSIDEELSSPTAETEDEEEDEDENTTTATKPTESKDLAQTITNALKNSIEKSAAAAGTVAAAKAATDAAGIQAGEMAAEKVSEDAMKLASVAGDLVNDIVNKNLEMQQKNLDRIDYAKSTTDATAVPEHISALAHDLAAAKLEVNLEAEVSGQYDTPKDLSTLKQIENTHQEVEFEQETIELGKMETVQTEEFTEDTDSIVNLEHLKNVDSPTKPVENLEELTKEPEVEKIDLPNLSSFEINEDGTSTFDNFATDINFNNDDEHLVDLNMPSNEFKIDDNESLDLNSQTTLETDLFTDNDSFENTIEESSDTFLFEEPQMQDDINNNDDFDTEFINSTADTIITEEISSTPIEDNVFQSDSTEISLEEGMAEIDGLNDIITPTDNSPENEASEAFNSTDITTEIPTQTTSVQDDLLIDNDIELDTNTTYENSTPITEGNETQDWMNDTNYDDLQDIEIEQPVQNEIKEDQEIQEEVSITEPEENPQKTFAVTENSTTISDRTFKAGEIPIDINNPGMIPPAGMGNESLEDLYNPDSKVPGSALLQNPGRLGSRSGNSGGAGASLIIKILGSLVVLALVCAIGFGVAKLFKTPTEETPQPITDDTLPTSPDNGVTESNTLNVNPDNVVKMDNNTNSLATTQQTPAKQQSVATKTAPAATAQKKTTASSAFIEVKKLTWEVPDYISYNQQFKQFFQAAGKSLKLSLTSDLLLASDYAFANEVRVSVTFDKDGTFKNAQIVTSSGSSQIDGIVLQTVNQTLKVLKAPHSVGNDESTTAILKIYL